MKNVDINDEYDDISSTKLGATSALNLSQDNIPQITPTYVPKAHKNSNTYAYQRRAKKTIKVSMYKKAVTSKRLRTYIVREPNKYRVT